MHPFDPFANRYRDLRLVGRGGFGAVYRAWDTDLDREVALKLLNQDLASDADWRRRFRQEASAASKLNHPNITIVYDRGEFEGQPFIVMEFVEGETLSKIIEHRTPLTDPDRLFLIEQLCDGLHYAHQRKIVHRDVKPVNLVVREEHDGTHLVRTLKILDFGIAKIVNASQTATSGQLMFTPNYVSPEQIRGLDADHRSDIFAVGAVAYELLVSEKAFGVRTSNPFYLLDELKQKIVEQPHRPMTDLRPALDAELVAIVDCALEKEPEKRYRDLAEMRRRVRRVRERMEAALSERGSQTTVVLHPKLQEEVKRAHELLEADDPSAAVERLDRALALAPNELVRRFVEQSLEEAKERQTAKRAERQAREEQAARDAIVAATTAFEQGDARAAIEGLEQFVPQSLVAEQMALLTGALAVIEAAERVVAREGHGEREAALGELEAFSHPNLVARAVGRLRQQAAERLDAEAEAERVRQREELERARQAIDTATEVIRNGAPDARERALIVLASFTPQGLVAEALLDLQQQAVERLAAEAEAERVRQREELERAREAIDTATEVIRTGALDARERALIVLASFTPQGLVAEALLDLQQQAVERRAAEAEAERVRQREELERARQAIDTATEAIRTGAADARERALTALASFTPQELVGEALLELRQVAEQLAEDEEAERARRRKDLERAQRAIDTATQAIRNGVRGARDIALVTLAGFTPADLIADALRELRQLAAERDVADARAAEEAAEARAQNAIASAREEFKRGSRAAAVAALERFDDGPRVADALARLRRADEAIDAAVDQVKSGDIVTRTVALERLAAFDDGALIADALAALRLVDDERREVEERSASELIESVSEQFDRGDREAALARLEAARSPNARVIATLAQLRARAAQLDNEEQLARDAQALIASARAAFMDGGRADAIRQLEAKQGWPFVNEAIKELRRASESIAGAERTVEIGDESERAQALAALAQFEPSELVRSASGPLRVRAEQRAAEERELRDAAAKTVERARALFVTGEIEQSLALLNAFAAPALIAESLASFQRAAAEIETASRRVIAAAAPARQAAIAYLAGLEPRELFASVLAELRHIDEARTLEEARLEALRVAAEAERSSTAARTRFLEGGFESAIDSLESFQPAGLVEEALDELRRAHRAIVSAGDAVKEGDDDTRQRAIDTLRAFVPVDLVARVAEQLQEEHLSRRAAERDARERYARGVQDAGDRIARALARRSVRAAEREVVRAERAYPQEHGWASARAEVEALRTARASEPSAFRAVAARVRRAATPTAIAGVVLVMLLASSPLLLRIGSTPAAPTLPEPPTVRLPALPAPSTSLPPSMPTTTARLVINALPWAEIVEVRNAGNELIREVPAGAFTPFALDLPTGQYSVTLRGPQGSGEQVLAVTVPPTGHTAVATFRIIDADDYFKRSGS